MALRIPEMPHACGTEKLSFCPKLNFNMDDDSGNTGYFIHFRGKKECFYLVLELSLIWAQTASVNSLD